ncbi:hypothetical protein QFZ72_001206 [Bacillus sp. V2I10]|nr:hypothetical protein [Bacillus sp. V2I10]
MSSVLSGVTTGMLATFIEVSLIHVLYLYYSASLQQKINKPFLISEYFYLIKDQSLEGIQKRLFKNNFI